MALAILVLQSFPGQRGASGSATDQEAAAPEWGDLDGQAGARILTCLDTLIEEARKDMPA
jgi:hypothetical protein